MLSAIQTAPVEMDLFVNGHFLQTALGWKFHDVLNST